MKHLAAFLATASFAAAASFAGVPKCAVSCLEDAVKQSTSCYLTETSCICKNFGTIQGAATGCIIDACGTDVALSKFNPNTQCSLSANLTKISRRSIASYAKALCGPRQWRRHK